MKMTLKLCAILVAGGLTAVAQAQPAGPGGGFGGPRHHRFPPMPLMKALDTNTNFVLEASEIANAPTALLTLDANKDGKLTKDELLPPPPPRPGPDQGTPPPEGMRPPPPPLPPVFKVLDANGDGELDATEIANASTALLKLDVNGDGQLTRDELRPPHPGGPGPGPGPDAPPPVEQ